MGTTLSPDDTLVRSASQEEGFLSAHTTMNMPNTRATTDPVPQQAPQPIRIIIAHDETIFRESLCIFLQTERAFEVVGACAETDTVLDLIRRASPDVVLLDSSIPQREGLDVLGEIQSLGMDVQVIVLGQNLTKEETVRVLQAGVRGIVQKQDHASSLIEAIYKVMQGEYWVGKAAFAKVIEMLCGTAESTHDAKNRYGLTPREIQIIAAVLEGYSNPEIAAHLSLSEQTVKHHVSHVFDKLGVYSRVELALFAVNHNISELA